MMIVMLILLSVVNSGNFQADASASLRFIFPERDTVKASDGDSLYFSLDDSKGDFSSQDSLFTVRVYVDSGFVEFVMKKENYDTTFYKIINDYISFIALGIKGNKDGMSSP